MAKRKPAPLLPKIDPNEPLIHQLQRALVEGLRPKTLDTSVKARNKQRRKELAEQHLYSFVRQAWHYVEPGEQFRTNRYVRGICDHLEAVDTGKIRNLLINIPPGCMKSLLVCVFWPAWVWTHKPESRWLFTSYSADLSKRDNGKWRALIASDWYQENWGDRFTIDPANDNKTYVANDKSGWRLATSVGGRGTGEHPDFIVADDIHNVKQADSDVQRQAAVHYWTSTMSSRGKGRGSRRVVVGQRLHENDLPGVILARQQAAEEGREPGDKKPAERYVHLCLPMRYEPGRMPTTPLGWNDPRTVEGELLFPQLFPEPVVRQLEMDLGSYGTAGQLQQRPSPKGGGIIQHSYFRYFTFEPTGGDDARLTLARGEGGMAHYMLSECVVFQTCDTAMKTGDGNDYTANTTFALTPEAELLILDVDRERVAMPQQYGWLLDKRLKWPQIVFQAVEDKAGGTGILQTGDREGTPFLALNPGRASKVDRASTIAIMYERGRVYHRSGAPWLVEVEDEVSRFPNAAHDDVMDTLSYAGILVQTGKVRPRRQQDYEIVCWPAPQSRQALDELATLERQRESEQRQQAESQAQTDDWGNPINGGAGGQHASGQGEAGDDTSVYGLARRLGVGKFGSSGR